MSEDFEKDFVGKREQSSRRSHIWREKRKKKRKKRAWRFGEKRREGRSKVDLDPSPSKTRPSSKAILVSSTEISRADSRFSFYTLFIPETIMPSKQHQQTLDRWMGLPSSRAHHSSFPPLDLPRFPHEILAEILGSLPRSDLISTSSCSRDFRGVSSSGLRSRGLQRKERKGGRTLVSSS